MSLAVEQNSIRQVMMMDVSESVRCQNEIEKMQDESHLNMAASVKIQGLSIPQRSHLTREGKWMTGGAAHS